MKLDQDWVEKFETCTLPAEDFRHRDHIRLAWIYLQNFPFHQAMEKFTTGLKKYASHMGVPSKYHETITWAYLILIHERMFQAPSELSWEEFEGMNQDLFEQRASILTKYYDEERLHSPLAKAIFLLPQPFIEKSSLK